jgi:hypothetical protein
VLVKETSSGVDSEAAAIVQGNCGPLSRWHRQVSINTSVQQPTNSGAPPSSTARQVTVAVLPPHTYLIHLHANVLQ